MSLPPLPRLDPSRSPEVQQAIEAFLRHAQETNQSNFDTQTALLQQVGGVFTTRSDGSLQMVQGTGSSTGKTPGSIIFVDGSNNYAEGAGLTYSGGTLGVQGTAQVGTLTTTGNGSVAGNLTVSGSLSSGATTLGAVTASALTVSGTATLSGALTVAGAATLSSTLTVTGAGTFSSTLAITGAGTFSSTLAVTGKATLSAGEDITGQVRIAQSGTLQAIDSNAPLALTRSDNSTVVFQLQNSSSAAANQYGGFVLTSADLHLWNSNGGLLVFRAGPAGSPNTVGQISAIGRMETQLGSAVGSFQGVSGLASTQTGLAGNNAGSTDTILFAATLPANTLGQNGDCIYAVAAGVLAANANAKTIIWKFAANSVVVGTTSQNGGSWYARLDLVRVDSTHFTAVGFITVTAGTVVSGTTNLPVSDLGLNALNLSIVGNSAGANDVQATMFKVVNQPVYA